MSFKNVIDVNVMRANAYDEIAKVVSAIEVIANITKNTRRFLSTSFLKSLLRRPARESVFTNYFTPRMYFPPRECRG
jgi:hypothetical protein